MTTTKNHPTAMMKAMMMISRPVLNATNGAITLQIAQIEDISTLEKVVFFSFLDT